MKDFTDITILLDRSGSMNSCRDETINGFNVFLAEQRKAGNNAALTLVQFDSAGIDTTMDATPIANAFTLNHYNYTPRASTPLLDALGRTIVNTGKRLEAVAERDRPDKVVFVIITDGEENASREYKRRDIKKMIDLQQSAYKWQFIYLGANQDAFLEAGSLGIHVNNVSNYDTSSTTQAFAASGSNLLSYRTSNDPASLSYSNQQRETLAQKR